MSEPWQLSVRKKGPDPELLS